MAKVFHRKNVNRAKYPFTVYCFILVFRDKFCSCLFYNNYLSSGFRIMIVLQALF